jgi:uncharacterized protein (DUF2225 family)
MVDIKNLSDTAHIRKYAKGTRIAGAPGSKEFYIIVSGHADVYVPDAGGGFVKKGAKTAGQVCGMEKFFGKGHKENYLAAEKTTVFVIGEAAFDRVISASPRLAYDLLQTLIAGDQDPEAQAAPAPQPDSVQAAVQKKLTSQVDQDNVAKVRDAFRQKYSAKKSGEPVKPVEKEFPGDLFPMGHKSYPNITQPEQLKFIYDHEYKCPNCKTAFTGPRVFASRLVPKPVRYDLRKSYTDFTPEWYEVLTCPHCYFSMYSDLFADASKYVRGMVDNALAEARSSVFMDFDSVRDIDFVFSAHYIALACTKAYSSQKQLDMQLWASISWLYEDVEDREMMAFAARKAADAARGVYEKTRLSPENEQTVALKLAGMLYHAGEKEEPLKWLLKVKTLRPAKKSYIQLADTLIDLIRQEKDTPPAT